MNHPLIEHPEQRQSMRMRSDGNEVRTATYSSCGLYRFDLQIVFRDAARASRSSELVQFIGLNPSTATEMVDDPTVRRCKRFARDWGFGGMVMTNAFAFRSTDPRPLYALKDPVGASNDEYLAYWANHRSVGMVVLCYGNHGILQGRHSAVVGLLHAKAPAERLHCLGMTGMGYPKHPLYLAATTKPAPFTAPKKGTTR